MPKLPRYLVRRGNAYQYRRTIDGREIRKSLGQDLREARRMAQDLTRHFDGTPIISESVAAFADRWMDEFVGQRRVPQSVSTARYRLDTYILPVIGQLDLTAVRVDHLRALRGSLDRTELSRLSVKHVLSDVRCMLRYAVDVGDLERSPWSSTILPRIPEVAPRRIPEAEIPKVLASLQEPYLAIVELGLHTGLRWGELRRLQWRDVVMEPSPHLVLERTKSGKVRRVPLEAEGLEAIHRLRARTSSVFVLDWRPKVPRWAAVLSQRTTGVAPWHFHQLRHTFACRWLESGGSKESLQHLLGHASITTTERYGALSDDAVFRESKRVRRHT